MSTARYHSLDSLRGIASLQVVIGHCLVALPALNWLVYEPAIAPAHDWKFYLGYSPLHFFWSASPAVKVFFVLSGFVLSLPYYNKAKTPNYIKFFIKRILRLYIPCITIVMISVALAYIYYDPARVVMFGDWLRNMWHVNLNGGSMIDILLLNIDFSKINIALWTIPPEIKLSLILPLFILFQKKINLAKNLMFIPVFVLAITALNKLGVRNFWPDFATFYYLVFFIVGSLMCKYKDELIAFVNRLPNSIFYSLLAFSVLLYTYNYSLWWLHIPAKALEICKRFDDYISTIASIFFIAFALSDRAHKIFNSKSLMFLGKISFSLYLIHPVLITLMAYLLASVLSPNIIVICSFVLCFPVAFIFYKLIEAPSVNLATKTSNYLYEKFFKRRKHVPLAT